VRPPQVTASKRGSWSTERVDGIFVDLQMPQLDGFELTRRIRASSWNKSAPIVVVTGNASTKTMQIAFTSLDHTFSSETCRQAETNQPLQGRSGKDGRETPSIRTRSASDGGNLPSQISHLPSMSSTSVYEFKHQSGSDPFRGGMFPVTRNSRLTDVSSSRRAVRVDVTGVVARIDEQQRAGGSIHSSG
jgi:hypothetical protein